MRLVNLDDAVKALEQAYPNDGQMSCHDAVAVIGTVPTIEPRKKGKWTTDGRWHFDVGRSWLNWKCSECGKTMTRTTYKDGDPKCPISDSPYCWYCGAKMEEGEGYALN